MDDPVQHTFGIAKGAYGRPIRPTLPVRVLPCAGAGVPPVRPGPAVLRRWVRGGDPPGFAARLRATLPMWARGALQARFAYPALACAPEAGGKNSDASGFPLPGPGCFTASHTTAFVHHCCGKRSPTMHHHYKHHCACHCGHDLRAGTTHHRYGAQWHLALPLVLHALPSPGAPGTHPSQSRSSAPPWP